jgi:hypothetical protein
MAIKTGTVHLPSLVEKAEILRSGEPAGARACLDDARRYSACTPALQARCNFFANGQKLPGCVTFPRNGEPFKLKPVKPLLHNRRRQEKAAF